MKTGTVSQISTILLAGLLALGGVLSDARPARAQVACPLPEGVSPPAGLPVTAQQVEDGSASLMEFALAARDRSSQQATSQVEAAHLGCLFRQEGSDWRSGSTFLVSLTPDGRIYVHAKDMSLSGGQLDFRIYGAVLAALGIDPAALADPATAIAAFTGAIAGDGGAFDVPGFTGASGYAAAYYSANFQSPIVLLAGFDVDRSHLAAERIEHLQPAVTARDVVDRATLKAFVDAAGAYFIELMESGDVAASNRARIAFRDPDGPWKHGSVYLSVMDPGSRVILFHGGFPDRFELRRGGIATDIATGELVVEQLIRAANSSPDGGFWEYYFDNPADQYDSAEVPKTGYARLFAGNVPGRGEVRIIVNSGFYPDSTPAAAADSNRAVETALPQIMRAMTAGTVDAISARMRGLSPDAAPAATASLGGSSTLGGALLANRHALENGSFDPARLLAGSSFVLPLGAAEGGASGLFGNLALWGSGDYRSFSGGNRQAVDYDGEVTSGSLGMDARLGGNVLAGLAVGRAQGTVDFSGGGAPAGDLTSTVTSITPYAGWHLPGGMKLWVAAGHGWGEVEVDEDGAAALAGELTQQMVAAGASGPLAASDRVIEGGTTTLGLKGEASYTRAELDGSGRLADADLSASRVRAMFEASHAHRLAGGSSFTPSIEIGMRHDGGDGETGNAVETGAGFRFADPSAGLVVEARARTLLGHGEEYEEWGVGGSVRVDPGAAGRGLSIGVQPGWGRTASGVKRLWESGIAPAAEPFDDSGGRVSARIAYGIGIAPGAGVLTPYGGLTLSDSGYRRVSLGGRLEIATAAGLNLEAARSRAAHGAVRHAVTLRGHMSW